MLVHWVLSDRYRITQEKFKYQGVEIVNATDVLGQHPLQQSLVIESFAKMLVRRVLSDRHRVTQEKFK